MLLILLVPNFLPLIASTPVPGLIGSELKECTASRGRSRMGRARPQRIPLCEIGLAGASRLELHHPGDILRRSGA
jgi:hypothetical protein